MLFRLPLVLSFCLITADTFAKNAPERDETPQITITNIPHTNEIVAYFDSTGKPVERPANKNKLEAFISSVHFSKKPQIYGYYRILLGETEAGSLVVQDFYQHDNRPKTEPYTIKNANDLKKWSPPSVDGRVIYWNTEGYKWKEAHYKNGQPEGIWIIWNKDGSIENEIPFNIH